MTGIRPHGLTGVIPAILALALVGSLSAPPTRAEVQWRNGGTAVPARMDSPEMERKLRELAARQHARHVVLHLAGPLGADRQRELEASGVTLLSPLGGNAFFASLTPGVDIPRALAAGSPVAVEPVETARKLHPDLASGIVREWSIVEPLGTEPGPDPLVAVYVLFHRDFDLRRADELVARRSGWIRSLLHSVNGAVVHLRANEIEALAAEDDVMYVEPPLPPMRELNDDNRPRVGAEVLQEAPYGLDGFGVMVMVYDGGRMFQHGDFGSRLTIGASDTAGISDHATHVGGTIGGDGTGSGGQYRGMAPGVNIVSYGFQVPGGLQQGFLYTDPGDLESDYTEAIEVYGANIANNSIGTNTSSNGYPCEWEGNYGTTGALIDAIAAGSLGEPFRIVWANGNERQVSTCGSTYVTTAPPACAKNHVTVGALNSNNDGVTGFTSWGPCDDGRIKPDISGPGCQSGGDGGVTSTSSSGGYNTKCGTSMASPTITGVGALLIDHFRSTFPGRSDFRNSTLKAILAQTAEDIENTGPDYKTGYGSVRAIAAVDLITDERFVEQEVGQAEIYRFVIAVGPDDDRLQVTLAWDDPPGTPNVNPVLVNDLDLRVIAPDDTVHYPWTLDPGSPTVPAVRTQRDGVNNIEQVTIDSPAAGAYLVEVEGFNIAQGATQSFSAAGGPTLFNCASRGTVNAKGQTVACESAVNLSLIDCDANLDDGAIDTIAVTVTSQSEAAGETVLLVETAPASSSFEGALPVSGTDSAGVLHVTEDDTVTVTYIDADDGEGGVNVPVVDSMTVDCSAPDVTSVTPIEIRSRRATVEVDVDELASITLRYGTVCGSPVESLSTTLPTTQEQFLIEGLNDDTTYLLSIEATDAAGNTVIDDNGAACYSIHTNPSPDYYTEEFGNGIDLEGRSATFVPDGSPDHYAMCIEPLSVGLPTNPLGGTTLTLSDSESVPLDLAGGAVVQLYGVPYSTIHVGSNGFLTFGAGDSDSTESIDEHFDLPRVAALWDDLDPGDGGSVSWKQLADRVAVTWEEIPEDGSSNRNTFQVEMFFDRTIRISWTDIDVLDAVVGLSGGFGRDEEFEETNLSGGLSCGPRPPVAADVVIDVGVGTPAAVSLLAGDDGLPEPAALTYSVLRLPSFGSLTDEGSGTPITSVPHVLSGGGSQVTYTPQPGVQALDYFQFGADDGGLAPDGGISNIGTVSVRLGIGLVSLHEFLADDADPGWATTGDWAFGTPTGAGSHGGDPTAGFTGNNVFGYNLNGDYGEVTFARRLSTPTFDLTNRFQTRLVFERWLGIEALDTVSMQISDDGSNWTTFWDNGGQTIDDRGWVHVEHDISGFADDESSVSIRWTLGPASGPLTYPGWNIDDIRIMAEGAGDCSGEPLEVPGVRFPWDKQILAWDPAAHAGGFGLVYDVLRADQATGFSAATCVETDDISDRLAIDSQQPAAGSVFFYLIRGENNCGGSPLGLDSFGVERQGTACLP